MLFEVYRCVQLDRWSVVCGCVLHRGAERGGVVCFVDFGRGDLGDVLIYEFVMVALQEVCVLC